MSVSKEFLAEVIADVKAKQVAMEQHQQEFAKQFALDVANGMCPECCEFDYCHSSCEE